jgi:hypothetical protein
VVLAVHRRRAPHDPEPLPPADERIEEAA